MTDIEIESQIRDYAYALWESEGRPDGRDVEHWLAAEAMCWPRPQTVVRRTRSSKSAGAAAKATPRKTPTARKVKTATATNETG